MVELSEIIRKIQFISFFLLYTNVSVIDRIFQCFAFTFFTQRKEGCTP